ncbi:3'-5' exonuclease [Corallococcus sp. AS-1-12]|uniref:3'-5' exonuclease n=1 Tax=Corallococcus sp. AS-1-12 TaxID=2874598 RepID=UPI001CBD9183|nr:3'-5' exonuclease [Corallococcus sp. AS-1-12]MBZ4335063.1 SIR2 family protein [Corallococcus sp. AS-1-12]
MEQIASGLLNPTELLGIQHLIVDEFQDLNPCDLEFINSIADSGVTTFVAGDDDQSIYSFRFASPLGIQTFHKRHPTTQTHVLEGCFRCTPSILSAARAVLSRNLSPQSIPKNLYSLHRDSTENSMLLWSFETHKQEALAIAKSCRSLIDSGVSHREIVILLSNRRIQEKTLSDAFDAEGLPYSLPREDGYGESDGGRLALSCLRIACNGNDYVAHRTLLGVLPRIGISTCNGIAEKALVNNLSYIALFKQKPPPDIFTNREAQALSRAVSICEAVSAWAPEDSIGDRKDEISEILLMHLNPEAVDAWLGAIERLPSQSTLKEALTYIQSDTDEQQTSILDNIALRLDNSPPSLTTAPMRVRILTVHGAKGLGAQVVFIPGMEDDIWPGEYRNPYPGLVQEAARLLYVAITRSRAACIVSHSKKRFVFGTMKKQTPSRFGSQLNGRFTSRSTGLSTDEANRIRNSIEQLQPRPAAEAPERQITVPPTNILQKSPARTNSIPNQSLLIDDLRNKLATGQVLCIVGAGASIAATNRNQNASWLGLLRSGLEYCMQVVQPPPPMQWRDNIINDIETGRITGDTLPLLSAAEKISQKLGAPSGAEFSNWLDHDVGALKVVNPSLIKSILALGTPIATTNYDGLIEDVSGLPPVSSRDPRDIERAFRGERPGIVHLHGWWRHPDTVVLGLRSYESILANAHGQAMLQALASMKTLVFIGFGSGLDDPNFGSLLQWRASTFRSSSYRHYQLARFGETINAGAGLSLLYYGTEHSDLEPFLKSLIQTATPSAV